MDDNIYTITLSNGTILTDLKKRAHNFVSKTKLTESTFDGGLDFIKINDGISEQIEENMILIHVTKIDDEWLFELIQAVIPEEKTYTITFNDGTSIGDLKMNGNNFISKNPTEIPPDIFDGVVDFVSISDGQNVEEHFNVEFSLTEQTSNEWWFIITDVPSDVLERSKLRADVDFIAMMTDIEL